MSYLLLLGIADKRLADALRAQLSELPDVRISSVEGSSGDVVGALTDQPGIDVLLLHEGLGPLPTLQLTKDLSLRHPHLAVVLVAENPTPETFSAAMEAGARAVLSSHPSLDELQARISTAAEWSRSMRRHLDPSLTGTSLPGRGGTLVALAGAKGGTGTTTLAVHLAMVAAGARRTVCLVDMDLQAGDVPSYLDLTYRRSIADLVDVADDINPTVLSDTLFVHPAGPHILLAPAEGERGEDVTARVTRQVLGSLRSLYEIVIADCGTHMTEAGAMAIEMADRAMVTATPDMPALRAARRLAKLWTRLQVRKGDDLGVVLTRASRNNEIQPDFARKILRLPTARTVVPAAFRGLEGAANAGTPSGVDDDGFNRAMVRLAGEVGVLETAGAGTARRKKRRGADDGQATVEFAGLLPLLMFVLLALWQVVLVGWTFIAAGHAATEGARAASLGQPSAQVVEAATQHIPLGWEKEATVHWNPGSGSGPDYVRVEIVTPVLIPGVLFAPGWPVQSEARVVHEQ